MAVAVLPEAPEAANLLDLDPELAASVGANGSAVMRRAFDASVVSVAPGPFDLAELLSERGAHLAVLVDGMVIQRTQIAGQGSVEVLGPGDLVSGLAGVEQEFALLTPSIGWRAPNEARLALMGPAIAYAAARWPALGGALRRRVEARHARLATLHAIAQIPRAEARLYMLLWLLAERFGRVTSDGVVLGVVLPYRTIGEMIGARRSTISLAMKSLREAGAVSVDENGTILLHGTPG